MQKILEGSLIYRAIAAAWAWLGAQWRKSRIISLFLAEGIGETASANSIFTRIWLWFHRLLCTVFEKLRLNKLLRGSIFTMPFIWGVIVVFLAPILPTMAVLGLSLVCIVSLILAFACDREKKLAYSPMNKFILLYAFIYIVATLTSVTLSGSLLGGALTTLFILFAIFMQNAISTRRQLDTMILALVVSGAAVSLYGVYQYFFGTFVASGWVDSMMFSAIGVRVYSTLGNPNVLSEYLLLVIPFTGACIILAKKIWAKLFFTGCIALMLMCMLLTFARGGWLGLIVAVAVFLILIDRRFIIFGVIGLVLLYFVLPDVILNRFSSIGDTGDTSTSFRLFIWLGTISMLRDYWFTGIGPGTDSFNMVYPFYSYNTIYSPHSHNLYLQIICDAGITGIIVFIAIIFTYIRSLGRAISHETEKSSKILQIASISAISGFLVQSFTDYSFYNYRVTLVFWAVLGIGALMARRDVLKGGSTGWLKS